MKPKEYEVLRHAVEEGVAYGYMRAFKYTERPSPETIKDTISESVMDSVNNWFTFDDISPES